MAVLDDLVALQLAQGMWEYAPPADWDNQAEAHGGVDGQTGDIFLGVNEHSLCILLFCFGVSDFERRLSHPLCLTPAATAHGSLDVQYQMSQAAGGGKAIVFVAQWISQHVSQVPK